MNVGIKDIPILKIELSGEKFLGLDTETYGLEFDDEIFSVQIASSTKQYYFNFKDYPEEGIVSEWNYENFKEYMGWLFDDETITWAIANAKFDMLKLRVAGIDIAGEVHDTMPIEKIINNKYFTVSLDACLKRRGSAKNDKVKEYISKHKLFTDVHVEGKKKADRIPHYDQVPFNIMYQYGLDDTHDALFVAKSQLETIGKWNSPAINSIVKNEYKLTKVCSDLEYHGIKLDVGYTKKGLFYERDRCDYLIKEIEKNANLEYKSGPLWLAAFLDQAGVKYNINKDTGNPEFDADKLSTIKHPVAPLIIELRTHEKYANTYYSSFLKYKDANDMVHAAIQQASTDTARFSYWNPNLQNIPKEDEGEFDFYVRKCFIPDSSDYLFAMLDYDQEEYKVMLDYANEQSLIKEIQSGLDVHQATANLMGVNRKAAKTLNFMLLYGGGIDKLAAALNITQAEAKHLKELYFSKLPKVKKLIYSIQDIGVSRGYIKNAYGRRYQYEGVIKTKDGRQIDTRYKLPNYLIQGTCGDIMRHAMVKIFDHLSKRKARSSMKITVHDELVCQIHKNEIEEIFNIKKIMEEEYKPINGMYLTTGIEHSFKSWGRCDITDGAPV